MYTLMVVVFVIGYLFIALEHNFLIDKAASALVTGITLWTILVFGADVIYGVDYGWSITEFIGSSGDFIKPLREYLEGLNVEKLNAHDSTSSVLNHFIGHELQHHVVEIAEILFFLLGAMTIVELIDAHGGFSVITDKITTTKKSTLIWILSLLTFFFSAALDNLTTAIVMAALLKKLIEDKEDLWLFAGVTVIAANSGGAWSPIGDVTTIMLWIGGQITAANIVANVFVPSLISLLVPLIILSFTLKGNVKKPSTEGLDEDQEITTDKERKLVFFLGVISLLQVPVYKTLTHLPPFMGVLLGLGMMWTLTEILHRRKSARAKSKLSVANVLRKIDTSSIMFFLGILLAVGSLQSAGHLTQMAAGLEKAFNGNIYAIDIVIGLLSSIVDNVPLVAGAMGMYEIGPLQTGVSYPVDHEFWEFLAYTAGTGGSCLIIGSAAGVAIMGLVKINFVWYIKRISLLALAGYLAGGAYYYVIHGM